MYLIGSQYNIRIFRIMNNLFYNALRVNNKDWQTNSEEKFTYEFNEYGDWIRRIAHKKNKDGSYTITGGTYREFLNLEDIKNQ